MTDTFSDKIIENIIRGKIRFSKMGPITRIHGGFVKHTYKIILDRKPYILQIWKEPDTFLTIMNDGEDDLFGNDPGNLIDVQKLLRAHGIRSPEIILQRVIGTDK